MLMMTTSTITALVIPVAGPLELIEMTDDELRQMQDLVGGPRYYIQASPLPPFISEDGTVFSEKRTMYASGTFGQFNPRATEFMEPGVGIPEEDYIAGPAILVGRLGDEALSVPEAAVTRARLIESQAA